MCEQLENKKHWDLIKGMKAFYLKKPTSVCINLRSRAWLVNYDKKSFRQLNLSRNIELGLYSQCDFFYEYSPIAQL